MYDLAPKSKLALMGRWYILLMVIPLLFGVITGGIALVSGQKAQRLAEDGVTVQGEVTDREVRLETDSDGDQYRVYFLDVAFEASGWPVATEAKVSRRFYDTHEVGDSLPVLYWRQDPQVNEIEPGKTGRDRWVTTILAAISLAAAGYVGLTGWRKAVRWSSVRDHGERRSAVIDGHKRTAFRINNRQQYRVIWVDSAGVRGQSFLRSTWQIETLPEGKEIWIYADPRGRLASVWEADVGKRAD